MSIVKLHHVTHWAISQGTPWHYFLEKEMQCKCGQVNVLHGLGNAIHQIDETPPNSIGCTQHNLGCIALFQLFTAIAPQKEDNLSDHSNDSNHGQITAISCFLQRHLWWWQMPLNDVHEWGRIGCIWTGSEAVWTSHSWRWCVLCGETWLEIGIVILNDCVCVAAWSAVVGCELLLPQ